MGLFKKMSEDKKKLQEELLEVDKKHDEKTKKTLDKQEAKMREKARLSNFDVDKAVYVFQSLPNDDEKGTLNLPIGAIFPDRVVKFQKRWTGNVVEEIPVKSISSVEISKGLLPTVTVYASANNITFKVGLEAQKIASTIRELMSSSSSGVAPTDPVTQLEKLAKLLEKGLLTKEEFEKKKIGLLNL
jgi:uncharacterized FlaG/YvyC family protein